MTNYQLSYLISPELSEQEAQDCCQKIDSLIAKAGQISKTENPKRITLAYPIQKKSEAFLTTSEFSAEAQQAETLKKELSQEKEILRFLLIKKGKVEKKEAKVPLVPRVSGREPPTKRKPEKKVVLKEIEKKLAKVLEK